MTTSAVPAVLLTSICLLSSALSFADEPEQQALTVQVLPTQRTAVYVWPILRGCKQDKAATDAVVRRLNADLRLQVHALSVPAQPEYLNCVGASCAELLGAPGCEPRTGIFVGGEVDESACDASDKSLGGCQGQLLSRLRVFRFDLEQNRATRGDYRYALCQEHRCGAEGSPVEESLARLIEQLVAEQSLSSPPSLPRATPERAEQCSAGAAAQVTPAPAPAPAAQELPSKAVLYAYYTQYKHLAGAKGADPAASYPSKDKAENEAKERASHFTTGANLPAGQQYFPITVNTKYALLPGEELVKNQARISTLQGYLTKPPAGPAYDALRQQPSKPRILIIFLLDNETKSLETFFVEPGKPLRTAAPPASCQAGGGQSATCVAEAVQAALAAASEVPTWQVVPVTPAAVAAQRPLGCIPFRERSCAAECSTAPAMSLAAPPPPVPAEPEVAPRSSLRNLADGLLLGALGLSVATAVGLGIADQISGPLTLTNDQGDMASVNGLLRPAEWTAWGISVALAIPTVITLAEWARSKPAARAAQAPAAPPPPAGPRCPISEPHS